MIETINAIKKYGLKYYALANQAIKEKAKYEGNQDGQYSIGEFALSFYPSVFSCSEETKSKMDSLVDNNIELFKEYAGDDGVFSTTEYVNLLNSDEYGAFIEEYNSYRELDNQGNKLNIQNC